MIQKLEQRVIGTDNGCSGASFSEVIDKVNEVIDYINSRPEEIPPCQTGFKGHTDPVGRRGRQGMVPRWISEKAEEYQRQMEPPYDSDDIISAYESGAMWNDKRFVYGATGDPDPAGTSDLEEAAEEWAENEAYGKSDAEFEMAYKGYIAGAECQKEQMMDEWLKDRDGCFWDGVEEGKEAMKEQMTKDAVEDALLLERAWLTLDGFGHEELAGRIRQFAERKGLIWK